MKSLNNFSLKRLIIFIVFSIVTLSFSTFSAVYADESISQEITYSTFEGDSFADNRVLVSIVNDENHNRKEYTASDFYDIDCKSINEITSCATETLRTNIDNKLVNLDNYHRTFYLELNESSKEKVIQAIDILNKREDIYAAGPNYKTKIFATPNDFLLNLQWGMNSINLPSSWSYVTGNNDVVVGIMDSGIDGQNIDLTSSTSVSISRTFLNGTINTVSTLTDNCGHGTHVAGVIGATGNNTTGITGVNWNVTMASLQVFNSIGIGDYISFALAINYAQTVNIPILNFSGGWSYIPNDAYQIYSNSIIYDLIDSYAGLLICAAGNSGSNIDNSPVYPACFDLDNIITVGAIDDEDELCYFSNYGSLSVDVYAPGENILSTYPGSICENEDYQFYDGTLLCELDRLVAQRIKSLINEGYTFEYIDAHFSDIIYSEFSVPSLVPNDLIVSNHLDDGYHYMSGTSMAAPFVTGVAALLLSVDSSLTASQIKNAILCGASNIDITIPTSTGSTTQNVKKLDAWGALKYSFSTYISSPYTLNMYSGNVTTTHTVEANNNYFNNKNGLYKLNVVYEKEYEFNITSSYPITVKMYNSNFTELTYSSTNITDGIKITKTLPVGTYYLRVFFQNTTQTGSITTRIVGHTHSYGAPYVWQNLLNHTASCECGDTHLQPHVVAARGITDQYATCLLCGGPAKMGLIVRGSSNLNLPTSVNGSYILPNGVIVLVGEDIDAYMNGGLVFKKSATSFVHNPTKYLLDYNEIKLESYEVR